jgi:hypothetical protein
VKFILRTLTSLGYVVLRLPRQFEHAHTVIGIKCASASCKPECMGRHRIAVASSSGAHGEVFLFRSSLSQRILSRRRSGPCSLIRASNSILSAAFPIDPIVARLYAPSPWTTQSQTW